jgi:HEXXH motif-containing protein
LPFVTGLYSEFLDESLYASRDSVYCSDVIPSIDRALLRIKRYSGPLFQDLCKTVRLIVITNDIGRPCYSCRTAYYGGIFINPSFANGLQIAESLIHEFLHQKFWLWWAYDPLASQERLNRLIVSPITGMTRTVEVMLQAALIYRECLSFYAWALQNEPLKEEESWTARRVAHLETGLKALYPILKSEAGSEGRVAAFLDAIVSI